MKMKNKLLFLVSIDSRLHHTSVAALVDALHRKVDDLYISFVSCSFLFNVFVVFFSFVALSHRFKCVSSFILYCR